MPKINIKLLMERKKDHITLAAKSQTDKNAIDSRFYYEPMFATHTNNNIKEIEFAGKKMKYPIWISSITGGTDKANKINTNLAKAANKFGLGMALGSCRSILNKNERFTDFDLRKTIGNEQPFYANLGIAQIEKLIANNNTSQISELISKLNVDGLFVHINPLQEAFQPEGDKFKTSPIKTLETLLSKIDTNIFVKEVGQGFGPKSIEALLNLPIKGIEFGAFGGTNFSKLELLRSENANPLTYVGHTIDEMIDFINLNSYHKKEIIISGGIKSYLDGYYYTNKVNAKAVYGQAYIMMKYASESYDKLENFIKQEIEGLQLANSLLKIR